MEKLLESQIKRTQILMKALEVTKVSDNSVVEDICAEIKTSLIKASDLLEKRKASLIKKKELCQEIEELSKSCNCLANRLEHINEGLCPEQSYTQTPVKGIDQAVENGNSPGGFEVSPCPSGWANGALNTPLPMGQNFYQGYSLEEINLPYIKPILPHEMNAVPAYMKGGRLTSDYVNSFITTLNSVLKQKYSIVKLKRKDVKRKDLIQYSNWKSQEVEYKIVGQIFFTSEDLANLGSFKIDKASDKVFQILRHTKRLRQSRLSAKIMLYILL